ncbi:stretch-activated cation channel Mid1 [Earliella scabrosa]|nr:stretch-activated cation channel Mid1 [Earliella scabrosa]
MAYWGLSPQTNYRQAGQLAFTRPVNLVTKSASFNCPLVHNLSFCPSVAHAAPLAPPPAPARAHTAAIISSEIAESTISTISNFTATLMTLACGRDLCSPLVTCADCQTAYCTWLCAISFRRCAEAPPDSNTNPASF